MNSRPPERLPSQAKSANQIRQLLALNSILRFVWVDMIETPSWICRKSFRTSLLVVLASLWPWQAVAENTDPMLFHDAGGLKVRGHLQFGLNAVAEDNLFWDLASTTAPGSGFDADTQWLEGYIKPGLSFEYQLDTGALFYG